MRRCQSVMQSCQFDVKIDSGSKLAHHSPQHGICAKLVIIHFMDNQFRKLAELNNALICQDRNYLRKCREYPDANSWRRHRGAGSARRTFDPWLWNLTRLGINDSVGCLELLFAVCGARLILLLLLTCRWINPAQPANTTSLRTLGMRNCAKWITSPGTNIYLLANNTHVILSYFHLQIQIISRYSNNYSIL